MMRDNGGDRADATGQALAEKPESVLTSAARIHGRCAEVITAIADREVMLAQVEAGSLLTISYLHRQGNYEPLRTA
jgi:hypothetical protein